MDFQISYDRENDETIEAKIRWFRSLPPEERMKIFCFFTEMILQNNPQIMDLKNAELPRGRFQIIKRQEGYTH